MRILLLFHSARIGGAELILIEAAAALAARGSELTAVLPEDGPLRELIEPYARVELVHHNRWAGGRASPAAGARWLAYNARVAAPRLAQLIERTGSEVVVSNTLTTMAGGLAARRAGVPHAWLIQEFGRREHGISFVLGRRLTFRLMRRYAQGFLFDSQALRDHFAPQLRGRSLHVAYPSVELAAPPVHRRGGGGPFRLICIGSISAGKGQADAVRALNRLCAAEVAVELRLTGSSEPAARQELEALATATARGRLRFGSFTREVAQEIVDADAVLVCARWEGLGRVTVEALKLGRPVIGARSGATPELIRHGETGLLYAPGDDVELAARVRELISRPDLARRLAREGGAWASARFNPAAYGEALQGALGTIADPRRASCAPRGVPHSG